MVHATPPAVEDALIAAYKAGVTVREIGEAHGLTRETVFNVLRRRGVPRRRRPGAKKLDFTEEELGKIRELRAGGWTKTDMCDALHTSLPRLDRALQQLGLPRRTPRQSLARVRVEGGYTCVLVDEDDSLYCMTRSGASRYALEHRIVMARALGRPLGRSESVHHINGIRDDNRIENLQLRQGKHGAGVVMTCRNCGSHDIEAKPIS